MINLIKKLIVLCLVAGVLYAAYFCIIRTDSGNLGVVKDIRTGAVVRTFSGKVNFIWQGALHQWYTVTVSSARKTGTFELKLPIPPLDQLKGESYSIKVPVNVIYQIIPDKFFDLPRLATPETMDAFIRKYIDTAFSSVLAEYLAPVYRRDVLVQKKDLLIKEGAQVLKDRLLSLGIDLVKFEVVGNMIFPEMNVYADGMAHQAELRKVIQKGEKDLKLLQDRLDQDKLLNEQYYKKLNEISKIIRQNPEILKYIYIDKISDKVELIIPADNSGFPQFLQRDSGIRVLQDKPKKGEINNLR